MCDSRRLRALAAAILALGLLFSAPFRSDAAPVIWDYNFSGASGGAHANVVGVDELQFLASSILGFRDGGVGGVGVISPGDTFQDYTVLRVTGFTNTAGDNLAPLDYGTGPGRTHELTLVGVFSGVQITANSYLVTNIELLEFYFDFGAGFTGSSFPDLSTFVDSPLGGPVETGVLGGPSGGVNSGPTAPDGTIDLIAALFDQLNTINGQYFELETGTGSPLTTTLVEILLGMFDANNLATPPGTPLGGLNAGDSIGGTLLTMGFADLFGPAFGLTGTQSPSGTILTLSDNNGTFDFAFQTRSDGSMSKALLLVPEPASLAMWSVFAVTGWACTRRRRTSR